MCASQGFGNYSYINLLMDTYSFTYDRNTIFGIKSVPSSLSYHIVKNIIFHLKELFLCYSLKEIHMNDTCS